MKRDLDTCPFCGGEATSFSEDFGWNHIGENIYRAFAGCTECGIGYELIHAGDDLTAEDDYREDGMHCDALEEQAIEMWNRRAERTCGEWRGDPRPDAIGDAAAHENDELWCEHCDTELDENWSYCPYCGARVVIE